MRMAAVRIAFAVGTSVELTAVEGQAFEIQREHPAQMPGHDAPVRHDHRLREVPLGIPAVFWPRIEPGHEPNRLSSNAARRSRGRVGGLHTGHGPHLRARWGGRRCDRARGHCGYDRGRDSMMYHPHLTIAAHPSVERAWSACANVSGATDI